MSSRITFLDLHYQSVGSMLVWLELTQVNLKLTSQRYFSKSRSRRGEIITVSTCSDHSHEKLSWDKMIGTRFEKNKVRYSVTATWLHSNVSKSWNWTDAPRSEILSESGRWNYCWFDLLWSLSWKMEKIQMIGTRFERNNVWYSGGWSIAVFSLSHVLICLIMKRSCTDLRPKWVNSAQKSISLVYNWICFSYHFS